MSDAAHRPATLAPPPLVYASLLAMSWWINHQWPLNLPLTDGWRQVGWGLLAISAVLMLWAAFTIWRHRTTVNPYRGASALVRSGPYAFSRNPIYLADAILYAGTGLLMRSGWPFLLAPVVWAIMHYGVILHEERHLRAKFGALYDEYCHCTGRWFGRKTGGRDA